MSILGSQLSAYVPYETFKKNDDVILAQKAYEENMCDCTRASINAALKSVRFPEETRNTQVSVSPQWKCFKQLKKDWQKDGVTTYEPPYQAAYLTNAIVRKNLVVFETPFAKKEVPKSQV